MKHRRPNHPKLCGEKFAPGNGLKDSALKMIYVYNVYLWWYIIYIIYISQIQGYISFIYFIWPEKAINMLNFLFWSVFDHILSIAIWKLPWIPIHSDSIDVRIHSDLSPKLRQGENKTMISKNWEGILLAKHIRVSFHLVWTNIIDPPTLGCSLWV